MSFLRVGAFVLVHAGMMMVVFVLAETAGPIAYWPIVVVGNVIVMVLEALLVAIQVLRLEYYELFSRFYSCLLYTSPSARDKRQSRMPSSA